MTACPAFHCDDCITSKKLHHHSDATPVLIPEHVHEPVQASTEPSLATSTASEISDSDSFCLSPGASACSNDSDPHADYSFKASCPVLSFPEMIAIVLHSAWHQRPACKTALILLERAMLQRLIWCAFVCLQALQQRGCAARYVQHAPACLAEVC